MSHSEIIKKLKLYKAKPDVFAPLTPTELADLVVVVLSQVGVIEQAIKDGRLDGYTPKPDKDYLSRETALKMLANAVNDVVARVDSELGQKGSQLDKAVSEAITRLQNGKDGIVTDAEIERAASIAFSMLELPDFDALITSQVTSNGEAVRDALELLAGEARYKVEIADVQGLEKILNDLAQIRSTNGGTIGKQQVYGFIRQAIADGTITTGSGSGHTIEDEGTPLTQRDTLNFVGAGVTVTDAGGKTVITIPGGGGNITVVTPTGTINGVNTVFSVASQPKWVVYLGVTMFEGNDGYTYSAPNITLPYAPNNADSPTGDISDQFKAVL